MLPSTKKLDWRKGEAPLTAHELTQIASVLSEQGGGHDETNDDDDNGNETGDEAVGYCIVWNKETYHVKNNARGCQSTLITAARNRVEWDSTSTTPSPTPAPLEPS